MIAVFYSCCCILWLYDGGCRLPLSCKIYLSDDRIYHSSVGWWAVGYLCLAWNSVDYYWTCAGLHDVTTCCSTTQSTLLLMNEVTDIFMRMRCFKPISGAVGLLVINLEHQLKCCGWPPPCVIASNHPMNTINTVDWDSIPPWGKVIRTSEIQLFAHFLQF